MPISLWQMNEGGPRVEKISSLPEKSWQELAVRKWGLWGIVGGEHLGKMWLPEV